MTIRSYRHSDLDDLVNIWHEAARISYSSLSEEMCETIKTYIIDNYLNKADIWVMEANGNVIAFIGLIKNNVGGLFVLPEYQNQGIAKALIAYVKNIVGTISLDVLKESTKVLKFYEKCGFIPTREGVCPITGLEIVTVEIEA